VTDEAKPAAPEPAAPAAEAPWVADIRHDFTSAAASVFLIHGLRDCYPYAGKYLDLRQFLYHAFCGQKHTVIYDIAQGLIFPIPDDEKEFDTFLGVSRSLSDPVRQKRRYLEPIEAIPLLQDFLFTRDGTAVIIDFIDRIVPAGELRLMSFEERRLLTLVRSWATDPRLRMRNSFVFLLAESLADVHRSLYAQGGAISVVSVPLPGYAERLAYARYLLANPSEVAPAPNVEVNLQDELGVTPEVLAENTNGLTLTQVGALLRGASPSQKVTVETISVHKRKAIEAEIGDLVEFVTPDLGLDAVAGVERQKQFLLDTAEALRKGRTEVVAQGILLTGPPGCGKTFSMQCFAHDCGIPFVQLKNVFSKYVGATESNLEKLFYYLEALAPVFVFIDEFDQSYGRRVTAETDSGVSRRVFGMFNAFLGDTSHQGKIVFGAATNRPDLIDPSTLRAGRFDVKLPFLLPDTGARESILAATLRTLGLRGRGLDLPQVASRTEGYSGADLRELLRIAQRRAVFDGRSAITQPDLDYALGDYISASGRRSDEIRLMELLAVAATTSRSMLPETHLQRLDSGELFLEITQLQLRLGE
jgi:AAA+ superfamily predicted ATPase